MNSMLGALVGDAAGATLEFKHLGITDQNALDSMKMPGGGVLGVGKGQITDDGELTLTIWNTVKDLHPKDGLPIDGLLRAYTAWYDSCPFDMGGTCSQAFEEAKNAVEAENYDLAELKQTIFTLNKYSEANGALMRASAIATWVAPFEDISAQEGAEFAMQDAILSHPNSVCQDVNAIYVFTIINLLRGLSPQEALEYTDKFVQMNDFTDKVKWWFFVESCDISDIVTTKQAGHVRWGFVLAFYFLRHPEIGFEEAIKITLMKGGDTDTNAAIVGGLVGAYHPIPYYMKRPVLSFDCTADGKFPKRPALYSAKAILGHLIK